tara:strand:- start:7640 stop:8650 length:1011 start_codon:yes stop_codon:yes gene_type:complete
MSKKLTYKDSGVNIKAADKFVKFISLQTKKTNKNDIGAFASLTNIPKKLKKPFLVTSTDGVGTKIELANELKKFDTIGIDLVAMCVNDIIVQGAEPLVFLDYISINKINQNKLQSIIKGIIKGCKISNCKLVGGETAEMPGTYSKGKFDIAGFAVGLVDKKNIIHKKIKSGDVILAIPSNGLHSNGYSLVRHILKKKKINFKKNNFLKKELLKPTKIYVKEIVSLNKKNLLNGCANITGGGIKDNLERVIPNGLAARLSLGKIKILKIFKYLNKMGVKDKDMLQTFNCGVGFCLIVNKKKIKTIEKHFKKEFKPYLIGEIINSKNKIKLNGKINWK